MAQQCEMFSKPRKHTALKGDGYPATPGSGPKGESCKTCGHRREHQSARAAWNKCDLIKKHWERSTDIRLDAPACLHWLPRESQS